MEYSSPVDDPEEDFLDYRPEFATKVPGEYKPKGLQALKAIRDHWDAGDYLPRELAPVAKAFIEGDKGLLLPSKKTLKMARQVVELLCSRVAKNPSEACKMVGRTPGWYYGLRKRHPGIIKNFEVDYYRDLEEKAERAKWDAKQKTVIAAAELAEAANERLKKTIENDEVAPAVQISAVKQVHDVLGVVGKRGEAQRAAQTWKPSDAERILLEKLMPKEVDAVDAEIVEDGRESLPR